MAAPVPRRKQRTAAARQAINVRLSRDVLKSLVAWIRTQPAPRPTKPEAIRRLLEQALADLQLSRKLSPEAVSKARNMARQALDRLSDTSLPEEEQERRKRRLTRGPREFRDLRGSLPKPKT